MKCRPRSFCVFCVFAFQLIFLMGCGPSVTEKVTPASQVSTVPVQVEQEKRPIENLAVPPAIQIQNKVVRSPFEKSSFDCRALDLEGRWKQIIYNLDGSGKISSNGEPEFKKISQNVYQRIFQGNPQETVTLLSDFCVLEYQPVSGHRAWHVKITELNNELKDQNLISFTAYYCASQDCSKFGAQHEWTKVD